MWMLSDLFLRSSRRVWQRGVLLLTLAALAPAALRAQAAPSSEAAPHTDAVVRAVYFFSPTCPACRDLAQRHLPRILSDWGPALELHRVDVSTPTGGALYQAAMRKWLVPRDRFGVPAVFVGTRHLVGTVEIPEQLPGLVAAGLEAGGVDWPDIPGLDGAVVGGGADVAGGDALGMALGFGVLLALLGAVGWSGRAMLRGTEGRRWGPRDPWLLGLSGIGIFVAGYLSWGALRGSEVLCGPVGSCSQVHASSFGTLAGVPVAFLGLAFFIAVAVLASAPKTSPVRGPLVAAAWAGAAFSIYLTAAELFVIGAVCSWCLASALVTAVLLLRVSGAPLPVASGDSRTRAARGAPG